jgi:hypothetical protein
MVGRRRDPSFHNAARQDETGDEHNKRSCHIKNDSNSNFKRRPDDKVK